MKLRLALLAVLSAGPLGAQNVLWGNSAQFTAPANIESFNKTTGARLSQFAGVPGNGRGIVVVGNVVYYTMVNDPVIHMLDATTGAPLGGITTSQASLATLAWDGTQFWTSDYAGTNRAFRINLLGVTTKTIALSLAHDHMDGMEFFNNMLISNRDDGGTIYDVYDLDGNVLVNSFINTGAQVTFSTGIAYDGTNFFVSYLQNDAIGVYNGTTGAFIQRINLTPVSGRLIEDLSVDYEQRNDTMSAPEPGTFILLGSGLLGVAGWSRRRKNTA